MANKVIAGDYQNCSVLWGWGQGPRIDNCPHGTISISKYTVDSYEVVDEKQRTSAASAVGRAAIGGLLLGPVGLLAGLSAKKKGTYTVAIHFKDGKNSLLELDESTYKEIMKALF